MYSNLHTHTPNRATVKRVGIHHVHLLICLCSMLRDHSFCKYIPVRKMRAVFVCLAIAAVLAGKFFFSPVGLLISVINSD